MTTAHQIEVSDCCGADTTTQIVARKLYNSESPLDPVESCMKCFNKCEVVTIDLIDCPDCGEECFVQRIDKHTTTLECKSCDFQYQILEEK